MKHNRLIKEIKIGVVVLTSFLLFSCMPRIDVNQPLELVWDKNGKKNHDLIIFLPGLYDVAEKFKKEHFFRIARNTGIKADMVAASVHLNHLLKKKMIKRLEKDLFQPALNKGYKNIWFVGVSLGGLNSLLFYQKHSKNICGVVLLAPYLGDKVISKAIENAGGIDNWQPDQFDKTEDIKNKNLVDLRVQYLWQWIKKLNNKNISQLYLGYGNNDRYAKAHKLFAKFLAEKNVIEIQGQHNWKTGQKIWQQQLSTRDKSGLLKSCN
ncbi:MAG: alpha/beta hydrolase [Gammaproteobacteria bacterium]|nr:alpha/beta hydrolase [Gammaproteobacteria bacterium]